MSGYLVEAVNTYTGTTTYLRHYTSSTRGVPFTTIKAHARIFTRKADAEKAGSKWADYTVKAWRVAPVEKNEGQPTTAAGKVAK